MVHVRSCRTLTSNDEQGRLPTNPQAVGQVEVRDLPSTNPQAASAAFPKGLIGPPFYGGFGNADQWVKH